MNWDSALVGVVIGALLSIIGNVLNHWFSLRKEAKVWERQQSSEKRRREEEQDASAKDYARSIYHNCISRLSLIEASKSDSLNLTDDQLRDVIQEALDWLAQLSLHRWDLFDDQSSNFAYVVREFSGAPVTYASSALQTVRQLAVKDRILYPDGSAKPKNDSLRRIQIHIDEDFRRKEMIDGRILPDSVTVSVDLPHLAASQRQKLWDQHEGRLGRVLQLKLPGLSPKGDRVLLRSNEFWRSKLNPNVEDILAVLLSWEDDYDAALEAATAELDSRAGDSD